MAGFVHPGKRHTSRIGPRPADHLLLIGWRRAARQVSQMRTPIISIPLLLAATVVLAQNVESEPVRESPGAALSKPMSGAQALRVGDVGWVCGFEDVIGLRARPISGERKECGIAYPVRVVRVGGIKLSRPTTMTCSTVVALRFWVETGVKPVLDRFGWKAERLEVAGGYACKTINNTPGGDISEHGKGHAIDIVGLGLSNGYTITVSDGWQRRLEGQVLRRLHRAACGPFRTVLGPEADRFHRNHFHFDIKNRSSPYCR